MSTNLAQGAALAALASAILFSAYGFADEPDRNVRVSYADLDLSTTEGAQAMLARLDGAARSACGPKTLSPLLPRAATQFRTCVEETLALAVHRLDSPVVTALHNQTPPSLNLVSR